VTYFLHSFNLVVHFLYSLNHVGHIFAVLIMFYIFLHSIEYVVHRYFYKVSIPSRSLLIGSHTLAIGFFNITILIDSESLLISPHNLLQFFFLFTNSITYYVHLQLLFSSSNLFIIKICH
jgi:hypothetical protein